MAKKKATFYEELEFDDVQYAVEIYNESKKKRDNAKKALLIAAIATVCNLYGGTIMMLLNNQDTSVTQQFASLIGIVLTVIAYVKGGGIGTAFKWSGKIALYVLIVFIIPLNLILAVGALMFSLVCFLCIPILFVFLNYRQVNLNYKAASQYIRCFKVKAQESPSRISPYEDDDYPYSSKPQQNASRAYGTSYNTDRTYGTSTRTTTGTGRTYATSTGSSSNTGRTYGSSTRTTTGTGRTYTTSTGSSSSTGRAYGTTSRTSSSTGRSYGTTSRTSSTGYRTYR